MPRTDIDPRELPLQRLYRWELERSQDIHLTQPMNGEIRNWTWAQTMDEARRVAAWLQAFGWEPGSRIGLYSKNCAWWLIADYAIWMAGYVSVPIFPTLTPASTRKILEHSDAKACIVGRIDHWDVARTGIPQNLRQLAFPGAPAIEATQWIDVLATQAPLPGNPIRHADELATLIYTSGTTGMPKGVMHNFYALAAAPRAMAEHPGIGLKQGDCYFCYLALAHVAERLAIEANGIYIGARIYFNDSLQTFAEDLRRARPHLFFAVPRLWTQFQLGVFAKIPEVQASARMRDPVQGSAFKRQLVAGMGLDRARFAGGGGATMPPALLEWYLELGVDIVEGYGMTENFACCTSNAPGDNRVGTVGKPWPGLQLRLSDEGEIQVQAPWIMQGYFLDPQGTKAAFTSDGFLRTGDKGVIDDDGRLRITGRIKEIFKTAKGKYVAPAPIENKLQAGGHVEAAFVTGADRPQPIAIIMLPLAVREALRLEPGKKTEIEAIFTAKLAGLNASLDPHERLDFLAIIGDAWTQESGHLTGTMKLIRDRLEATYHEEYEGWSAQRRAVVWHGQ